MPEVATMPRSLSPSPAAIYDNLSEELALPKFIRPSISLKTRKLDQKSHLHRHFQTTDNKALNKKGHLKPEFEIKMKVSL